MKGIKELWLRFALLFWKLFTVSWEKKQITLSTLIAISAGGWIYHFLNLNFISLNIALIPTILMLTLLFIGLISVEYIKLEPEAINTVASQTTAAVILVLAFLFYIDAALFGIAPLPKSLLLLLALLGAIKVTWPAVIACLIPPLVGYTTKFRQKWISLRREYPFWGIYLGLIGGTLIFLPAFVFIELVMFNVILRTFVFGGIIILLSVFLAIFNTDEATKAIGIFLVFMGILSWIGTMGGFLLGSILAIVGGASAYGWKPKSIPSSSSVLKDVEKRGGDNYVKW